MKPAYLLLLLLFVSVPAWAINPGKTVNVAEQGARGDGKTLATKAINDAIQSCAATGGGRVVVPAGTYLTTTILLRSNVDLHLDKGAVLLGASSVDDYQNYTPTKDLSHLNSGGDGPNANNLNNARWTRALILGVGVSNVTISGEGVIDGAHVFDAKGEENMRGPHALILAESRNVVLNGITIRRAANYAVTVFDVEGLQCQGITINEGWDGIHIRGGKDVAIRHCSLNTGDDAIAGGYWKNLVISDCEINSACNGMRVIMPVDGVTVSHCRFFGPGNYPHRTSGAARRTNMLFGILMEPGGWGDSPGDLQNINIDDVQMDNMDQCLGFVLNERNNAKNIVVENVKATRLNGMAIATESRKGGVFDQLAFRNVNVSCVHGSGRCWGMQLQHVLNVTMENMDFQVTSAESRPVFCFDTVFNPALKNVTYRETPGVDPYLLIQTGKLKKIGTK